MESKQTGRIAYWDTIKGFLIILVVAGHYFYAFVDCTAVEYIVKMIYLFHMPAFVFITGYFSKSFHSRSKETLVKLFCGYLIFNTLIMLIHGVINHVPIQLTEPYYSYWYLIALIVWRLTAEYLGKVKNIVIISVITSLFIGFWSDVDNTFALSKVITFSPFFLAGYLLPEERMQNFIHSRTGRTRLFGAFLMLCGLSLSFLGIRAGYFSLDCLLMKPYGLSKPLAGLYDLLTRYLFLVISALMLVSILLSFPKRPILLVTKWGRNSLAIFILHRYFTLIFAYLFPGTSKYLYVCALAASAVTLFILGSDKVSNGLNLLLKKSAELFLGKTIGGKRILIAKRIALGVALILFIIPFFYTLSGAFSKPALESKAKPVNISEPSAENKGDPIYPVFTEQKSFDQGVKILFAGDLILLEDQVKKARSGAGYNFTAMFEYTQKYISDADLAIAVFEGPMAGEDAGYSSSNYDDGIPLYLNYPDEFAEAVKNAGFDLVTTASNHILDKGVVGALRTSNVLDSVGLQHIGTYRNFEEKESVKIIELNGIRFAFLAYTYGSNYYTENDMLNGSDAYLTSMIVDPKSDNFEKVKASVLSDFERAKEENPDVIIVMPHMGTQFLHKTDSFQDTWNRIFLDAGADVILGDHAHAVQPVEVSEGTAIVNCPGNFVNSYREHNGDAAAMTELYFDTASKKLIGVSVIPMWIQSGLKGIYRALPIYDIVTNERLQREISTYEMERVHVVHELITGVMLGEPLGMDLIRPRYYLGKDGFMREKAQPLTLTREQKNSEFYTALIRAKSVCFVGDSITLGSKNGGLGWYEPLTETIPQLDVRQKALSGATVSTLTEHLSEIITINANLYVIAIGTNDVRYRDAKICAMTPEIYISRIATLVNKIKAVNPYADFVFISPWMALENDPYCPLPVSERDQLFEEYNNALTVFCDQNGYLCINPNPYLRKVLQTEPVSDYLIDHIHPQGSKGIALYSKAVLESSL